MKTAPRPSSRKRPAWMSPPSLTSPSGATTAPRCIPISSTRKISRPDVPAVIKARGWLEGDFISTVQQRGAAIIKARGLSSAASAANAAVNTVYKLTHPTPAGDWFSVGVHSDGSYGIEKGLIFSYPIRSNGKDFEIVQGVPLNDFSKAKITATETELRKRNRSSRICCRNNHTLQRRSRSLRASAAVLFSRNCQPRVFVSLASRAWLLIPSATSSTPWSTRANSNAFAQPVATDSKSPNRRPRNEIARRRQGAAV